MSEQPSNDAEVIRAVDVKPFAPPRVQVLPCGMVVNDENSLALHANDGSTTTLRPGNFLAISNPVVKRIEINDVLRVASLQTVSLPHATSSFIKFDTGGACVKADEDGNLRVFGSEAEPGEGYKHA